ncbi:DUF2264 domain-containing protein [Streptomyces sp. FXJ1.4098]|nr:DUF2264 domain-containing protein [Streptomyces sp. FXJ1.4098]
MQGLATGTDPNHPEYWGEPGPHDQRIVEMAAIGFALALAPDRLWDPLKGPERDRVARWLRSASTAHHREQLAVLPRPDRPRPRPGRRVLRPGPDPGQAAPAGVLRARRRLVRGRTHRAP